MQTTQSKPLNSIQTLGSSALAWLVCFCASLYFFYGFIQLNIFNSLDVYFMKAFHMSATETGNLSSLYFYANLIFLFPAGLILDRLSTRKVIIVAMIVSATSTLFFGLSHSLVIASVSRFMTGAGSAFCFLSCIRIASRWFPPQKLALATGVVVTMAMLGGAVAQTPLALLAEAVGWRESLLIDALLGYAITVVIWFTVQDFPPHYQETTKTTTTQTERGILQSLFFVMRNMQNWFCGLYTALVNLPIFLLGAIWGILYLNEVHHLTNTQASYATAMLFFGTIIGSPAFGWVSDLILKRKLLMVIGGATSLAIVLVLMYFPHLPVNDIVALFFLLGFFTSSQILSYPLIAEHNPISMTSSAMSIASSCIMLSGIVAQPLYGWLMERHWNHIFAHDQPIYSLQDFNSAMLIMPIAFLISLVMTLFIRETHYHTAQSTEENLKEAQVTT